MGIKDLSKVIADHAPSAIKENDIKNYFGRKVAIDASMSIYQFLIAVRQQGAQLTSDTGETTSHLMGMFYRTIRMIDNGSSGQLFRGRVLGTVLDNGIKPVYVFDGKPPEMKSEELQKRHERRADAEKELAKATEAGDTEAVDKFSRRLVKVTREHNAECKKLLGLMGVPFVDAPCEAEAQCAALTKAGVVYATATEDMDALTFGASVLLRHMTFSEAKKMPIKQIHYDKVLEGFGMSHAQFVDLCIMLGCDYCGSIKGIGQKKAFELIKQYGTIEKVLEHLDTSKYPVPDPFPYQTARRLFNDPDVADAASLDLKWTEPDEQGLVDYLVTEKGFQEERVRSGAQKLCKKRGQATQGRIDGFFKVTGNVQTITNATKRKSLEAANKKPAKKAKAGGPGYKRGK